MKHMNLGLTLASVSLAGCGGTGAPPSTEVRGVVEPATFRASPEAVEAVDEVGKTFRADLDRWARGSRAGSPEDEVGKTFKADLDRSRHFALPLEPGHVYTLRVVLASGFDPVVFPRADLRLDRDFAVKGTGAIIDLGKMSHLDAAPAGGFTALARSDAVPSCAGTEDDEGEDDEVEDDATEVEDDATEVEDDATEVEDDAPELEADPLQPMAVGEFNVPNSVAGCSGENYEGEFAGEQ